MKLQNLIIPLFVTAFLILPILSKADDTEGLVFHFDFSGAKGKKEITDETGKIKCVSESADFLIEHNALRLASGARIFIPNQESLPQTDKQLSFSLWILPNAYGFCPLIFKGRLPNAIQYSFAMLGRNFFCPRFTYIPGGTKKRCGVQTIGRTYGGTVRYPEAQKLILPGQDPKLPSKKWRHLAVTFNDGKIRIYINGVPVMEKKETHELLKPNKYPISIGAQRISGKKWNVYNSDALVNDLRMYSKALSDEAVRKIYDSEKEKYPKKTIELADTLAYLGNFKGYDPEFKKKLKMTAEYEKRLPKIDQFEKVSTSSIRLHKGMDTLFINNKPCAPMIFFPKCLRQKEMEDKVKGKVPYVGSLRDFAAAGLDLVSTSHFFINLFWKGEDEYDFTLLDKKIRRIIEANPQAKIIAAVYINAPAWFKRKYPDEKVKYYDNGKLMTWRGHAPLGSEKWLELSAGAIRAMVSHIEASDYAGHIVGYLPGGGGSAEWYWPGYSNGMTGYSKATHRSFRKWLREKYADNVSSLRKAWDNDTVTFENAAVPLPRFRQQTEKFCFRYKSKSRQVFDFRCYMTYMTNRNIIETCRAIKEGSDGKKIVIIYSGYSLFRGGTNRLANTGHLGYAEVLDSPFIDCFVTPISYRTRLGGACGANINAFTGSQRLRNKLILAENDLRTHLFNRDLSYRTKSLEESIETIRRSTGLALTRGYGLWWFPLVGHYIFHQEDLMRTIAGMKKIFDEAIKHDRTPTAEVALLFDTESVYYTEYNNNPFRTALTWKLNKEALRMGAPFDAYLLKDIANPKMPDYKVYIFMNLYYTTPGLREAIARKVRKNNSVAVWCYAPGFITDKGFDVKMMKELTGIGLTEIDEKKEIRLKITDRNNPITKLATEFKPYQVGPIFYVNDPQARILGTADGKAALAVREFPGWKSVYTLMPLTRELLTGLCDYAGVHVYARSGDVLTANKSYIMLHTSAKGAKTICLPHSSDVTELISGKRVGAGITSFTEELPAGKTKLYLCLPDNQ